MVSTTGDKTKCTYCKYSMGSHGLEELQKCWYAKQLSSTGSRID